MIITATTAKMFFALKTANLKPLSSSLKPCTMDILKLGGEKCVGVLAKDYVVYKKWINE